MPEFWTSSEESMARRSGSPAKTGHIEDSAIIAAVQTIKMPPPGWRFHNGIRPTSTSLTLSDTRASADYFVFLSISIAIFSMSLIANW